jgi:hypothetical protein
MTLQPSSTVFSSSYIRKESTKAVDFSTAWLKELKRKRWLGIPNCRYKDIIIMHVAVEVTEGANCIVLTQGEHKWRTLTSAEVNIQAA